MRKTAILWVGATPAAKDEVRRLLENAPGWTIDFTDVAESAVEHACAGDYAVLLLGKGLDETAVRMLRAVFGAHASQAVILCERAGESVGKLWDRIRAEVTQERLEQLRQIHVQDDGFSGQELPIRVVPAP